MSDNYTNYTMSFSDNALGAMRSLAYRLRTTDGEVIAKALALLEMALDADEVKLVVRGEEKKLVVK